MEMPVLLRPTRENKHSFMRMCSFPFLTLSRNHLPIYKIKDLLLAKSRTGSCWVCPRFFQQHCGTAWWPYKQLYVVNPPGNNFWQHWDLYQRWPYAYLFARAAYCVWLTRISLIALPGDKCLGGRWRWPTLNPVKCYSPFWSVKKRLCTARLWFSIPTAYVNHKNTSFCLVLNIRHS